MHKHKISDQIFWNLKEFNLHSVDFSFIYQIYYDELFQWNIHDILQIGEKGGIVGSRELKEDNRINNPKSLTLLN